MSAKVLIDSYKMYAPSVHCSYYSLLQLVKCKVHALSNGVLTVESYDSGLGSHQNIIKNFNEFSKGKIDKKLISDITSTFYRLKKIRKVADYDDQLINLEKAKYCYGNSLRTTKIIKQHLL